MADTLKSFLIEIGYKVDKLAQQQAEAEQRRVEERATDKVEKETERRAKVASKEAAEREKQRMLDLKKEQERRDATLKGFQTLATRAAGYAVKTVAVVEAAALGVVYAVDKAAKGYERLNYLSQRSGASAGRATAFGYATSQLGGSRDEADASLEAFGKNLRVNGAGYEEALGKLGVKTRDANGQLRDSVDLATDLGDALRKIKDGDKHYGYARALAQGSVFGFGETQVRAIEEPGFRGRVEEARSDQAKIGADPDAAAKSGTAFEQSMRHLQEVLEAIGTKISGDLFTKLKPLLDQLTAWFLAHGDEVAKIIARVADDLTQLATAIATSLAGADWDKIIGGVETLGKGFGAMLKHLGGTGGLIALLGLFSLRLSSLASFGLPPWLKAILGLSIATDLGVPNAAKPALVEQWDDEAGGLAAPTAGAGGAIKRLYNGAKRALGIGGDTPAAPPLPPGTPGTYRPAHALSDADLSDAVVDTVAHEAQGNERSTDAVINNMMNRLGTKAYGPSGNLAEVASAPNQYAGYGHGHTTAARAAYIRSRIRAIASGSVADETRGANEFRAAGYMGPWGIRHATAPVFGGNRFAYNPKSGRGAYAPYDKPRPLIKTPPMAVPKHDPDPKPVALGPSPIQRMAIASAARGSLSVSHAPTFNIQETGSRPVATAGLSAERGPQDVLRNVQGAEA